MQCDVGRGARARARVATFVVLVLGSISGPRRAHADPAEVESLISQGNQLRREGQAGRALPLFQKAHELARTPRTEAQLGLAEMSAGYFAEAEQHLAGALEFPQHPFVASNRAALTKALTDARAQVGELVIEGGPVGSAVKVNGRAVGALPLAAPIRMSAGRVDVEVVAEGHKPMSRSVVVRGRERQQVTVALERVAAASGGGSAGGAPPTSAPVAVATPTVATPAASAPPVVASAPAVTASSDAPAPTSRLRVAAWIAGGAAALALGVGVGFHLHESQSSFPAFDQSCDLVGNQPMPVTDKPAPKAGSTCQTLYDAWNTDKRWSAVGYIAGGALAVTSAILFWQSAPSKSVAGLSAHIHCAPGPATLFCEGRF